MDEARVGRTIRTIRIRRRWRQLDLAAAAGMSRDAVSRIERGRLDQVSLHALASACRALDASLDVSIRWHGGDLERLLNARHAALHEAFARLMARSVGWTLIPEVSFNVFGERGVIDVVLWHAGRRILVVVELKTEIVDVNELVGSVDRKRRLGPAAVRARGWRPASVGAWAVVADSAMNRARFSAHRRTFRAAFPTDVRSIVAWLRDPTAPLAALTFLHNAQGGGTKSGMAVQKRVRRRIVRKTRPSPSTTGVGSTRRDTEGRR